MNIAGAAILAAITMANAKSPSPIDLSEVDLKAVIEDVLEANPNADTAEIEAGVYDVLEDIGAGELVEEARAVVPPIIGNLRRFPVVFGDPSDDLIAIPQVVRIIALISDVSHGRFLGRDRPAFLLIGGRLSRYDDL